MSWSYENNSFEKSINIKVPIIRYLYRVKPKKLQRSKVYELRRKFPRAAGLQIICPHLSTIHLVRTTSQPASSSIRRHKKNAISRLPTPSSSTKTQAKLSDCCEQFTDLTMCTAFTSMQKLQTSFSMLWMKFPVVCRMFSWQKRGKMFCGRRRADFGPI